MISFLRSLGLHGMNVFVVKVGADPSNELPSFEVVELSDVAVKKSRDRVRATLKSCGFIYPVSKVTMDLAPANKRKEGPIYDLPVLATLLYASGQLEGDTEHCTMVRKLSLSGEVRPIKGILSMALAAEQAGIISFFVPAENTPEGAVVEGPRVYPATGTRSLVMHLAGQRLTPPCVSDSFFGRNTAFPLPDFSEVRGQEAVKRALEITASRNHSVLSIDPSGSGKSMLAKRAPSILPGVTLEEVITTTQIYSMAGTPSGGSALMRERPFRAPHHAISPVGFSGGDTVIRPGETLSMHNGVFLLDKLPEFHRGTMEVLCQPLEDGTITISRVSGSVIYPSSIVLVTAMNFCPCGYFGHPTRTCVCLLSVMDHYLGRTSGPFLNRLDLHVEIPPIEFDMLSSSDKAEGSARVRERVNTARERQNQHFRGMGTICNTRIMPNLLHEVCRLSPDAQTLLRTTFERTDLLARVFDRVLKTSRTIADLDNCNTIEPCRAAEAVQYRALDRKYWNTPRKPKGNVQAHYQSEAQTLW